MIVVETYDCYSYRLYFNFINNRGRVQMNYNFKNITRNERRK